MNSGWRTTAFVGLGIALMAAMLGGCSGNTPKSTENVATPGAMSGDKQSQYADRMKNGGRPGGPGGGGPGGYPGGGPGGPGGRPGYPGR